MYFTTLPKKFQQWQDFSYKFGSSTQLVAVEEDFSMADCVFAAMCSSLMEISGDATHELLYQFPRLRAIFDAVNEVENVRLLRKLPGGQVTAKK